MTILNKLEAFKAEIHGRAAGLGGVEICGYKRIMSASFTQTDGNGCGCDGVLT